MCWDYDHSKGRYVKGINFVTSLYSNHRVSLPVGFQLIAKTENYIDKKTQKEERRSPVSKNEIAGGLIEQAIGNQLAFRLCLFDPWFASAENMIFIKHEQEREFICPLKTNRKVAVSLEAKIQGQFQSVETLEVEEGATREIYLEAVDVPLLVVRQVFTNEAGSQGILYLVASDTTLGFDDLTTSYQRRWRVECYHTSLKQNVSLAKSPTHTQTTQTNHFFAALCGFIKLEMLKVATKTNHFAVKSKLYIKALHSAFDTLRELNPIQFAE